MLDILKDDEGGSDAYDGMFSLLMFFLFFINFLLLGTLKSMNEGDKGDPDGCIFLFLIT